MLERSFRFGPYVFDPAAGHLSDEEGEIPLAAKPASLLHHLLRNAGRVVEKTELIQAVWPDTTVSEAALQSVVRDLRRALGESGAEDRLIETVWGRGLRFSGDVELDVDPLLPDDREPPKNPWEQAVRQLEQALRALVLVESSRGEGEVPTRERTAILVALARARWAMGAPEDARVHFRTAADLARRLGDPEILGRAALGFVGRTDAAPEPNPEGVALLEEALEAAGPGCETLAVELRARLGTELSMGAERGRADTLTRESLAEVEALGDAALHAYVLTARHFVLQRPEVDPHERERIADAAIEQIGQQRSTDVLAIALQERWFDALELADGKGADAVLRRYAAVVDELDQPFFRWMRDAFVGGRALMRGDTVEAERLATETLARGRSIGTDNAVAMFASQWFALHEATGRLAELEELLRTHAETPESSPGFRAAAVAASHAGGADVSEELSLLLAAIDAHPRDREWLPAVAVVASVVASLGRARDAATVAGWLEPFAGRMVVAAHGAVVLGAVDHHLAALRRVCGDRAGALAAADAAIEAHAALGATIWLERSQRLRDLLG